MALNKQIFIYSIDTSAFFTDEETLEETQRHDYIYKKDNLKFEKNVINQYLSNKINSDKAASSIRKRMNDKEYKVDLSLSRIEEIKESISEINKEISSRKKRLLELFPEHDGIRTLRPDHICEKNIVSVFESSLTRMLSMEENQLYTDIIIVQTYYYDIVESIVKNGFIYDGEKYKCFTASAGQIRTKKTVFIKESVWNQFEKTLMCGLTIDTINQKGGVNVNKFLAYLALFNSATDLWTDFDIDKCIVVDDMETLVNDLVDYIDYNDYTITRKNMDVPITHTDGCGMILPKLSNKNFMVRLPWVKGLLAAFPFDKFINAYCGEDVIVKDIYGKEYSIIKDDIQIIFTKSQFKMYKYYDNWDEYKKYFKLYKCTAGKCNVEENQFDNAKLNYQMLQTLSDISDDELQVISEKTKTDLKNVSSDRNTMLKIFKATKYNKLKNPFQECLMLYPELLQDVYTKETLKEIKKSMQKDAWSAKLEINGTYTFLIPDLYAFCEWLFLNKLNPEGLLKNQEVYCKLFAKYQKLDCLRSPHLYTEHAVRHNVIDAEKSKWFITNGIYTSIHDLISKILQFDNDGDKSLVCADETIIKVAGRNTKDVVPLYYEMKKAEAQTINSGVIFDGLTAAYKGGRIGEISNLITKIWNSENINLDIIKLLCMDNNFTID